MVVTVTLNPALDALLFVERFQLHAKNIARDQRVFVGGKGFNVAKALAALGVPATAVGFVGRADAEFFHRNLAARGIRLGLTPIAATRTNLKITETDTGRETEINEPGAAVAPAELDALRQSFAAAMAGAEWAVITGSAAPGVPAAWYGDLIRQASARGLRTLLDASGPNLRQGIAAAPFAVHLNRAELAEHAGRAMDTESAVVDAARRLADSGTQVSLVSMGADGVLLTAPDGQWLARPPRLRAVSAVGAGDALVAGWIDAQRQALVPDESVRWATAVAAASVLTPEAGVLEANAARDLAGRVTVEKL